MQHKSMIHHKHAILLTSLLIFFIKIKLEATYLSKFSLHKNSRTLKHVTTLCNVTSMVNQIKQGLKDIFKHIIVLALSSL